MGVDFYHNPPPSEPELAKLQNHLSMLLTAVRFVVEAKVHNPNRSTSPETKRTLNVRQDDLDTLKQVYEYITQFK